MPNQGPNLVDQNTAGLREEIMNEIMKNEEILQKLQQNKDFQLYDTQLSNEGLIQQEPIFTTIEDDDIEIDVPYENGDESSKIIASYVNGEITNVEIVKHEAEVSLDYLWIILVISLLVVLGIILLKKFTSKKNKTIHPHVQQITVDNQPITNYVDTTNEILSDAKTLYNQKMYKDAHEKFGYAIRFYYSHQFGLDKELTSIETLQIIRKNKIKDFDSILDYLNLCGMIEFAKQESDEKTFFYSINEFSKIIQK